MSIKEQINYRMNLHYITETEVEKWWGCKNYLLDGKTPQEMLELDRGKEVMELIIKTIGDGK